MILNQVSPRGDLDQSKRRKNAKNYLLAGMALKHCRNKKKRLSWKRLRIILCSLLLYVPRFSNYCQRNKKTAAAILTPPPPSATVTVAPRGKTVEGAETVAPGGTAAPAEGVPISAIETFKEKLRKARSKEELEALLKELTAYRDGLRLLRQGQLEQGLAETSYEIKNTDRLISEAELLIEEIKKQLAKFSS